MHINSLERVQRHFAKRITELHDLSYQERLTVLNLVTLEYRRLSSDLTMYYNVFHNLTPSAPSDYFNVVIPPHNLHSVHHDFNIRKPLCGTNMFANDFLAVTVAVLPALRYAWVIRLPRRKLYRCSRPGLVLED